MSDLRTATSAAADTSPAAAIGLLELVEFPHPALRRPAKPLVRLDDAVREAVARMFDIMYEAEGIGLADILTQHENVLQPGSIRANQLC